MQDFALRVIMAALLSILCACATYLWSRSYQIVDTTPAGPQPLARLVQSTSDVQKRPRNRLIWHGIYRNQEFYNGEGVRTSSDAEASIEFLKDNTIVHMDPDTVIEIEEDSEGINLDFLKGNLFIRAATNQNKPITVKSGEKKIAIGRKSEVQFSRATKKEQVKVQVFKGKEQVKQITKRGETADLEAVPMINLLRPQPDTIEYGNPQTGDLVTFQWQPLDTSYQVSIETGNTYSTIQPAKDFTPVPGSLGVLQYRLKVGKTHFRLSATSSRRDMPKLFSLNSSITMRAMLEPVPLTPAANTILLSGAENTEVPFSWSNPGQLTNMFIQISRKKNLADAIHERKVGNDLYFTAALPDEFGAYYWRVSGLVPGSREMATSPVQRFFLQKRGQPPLIAPILRTPPNGKAVSYAEAQTGGVQFSWNPVVGAIGYDFILKEFVPEDFEGEEPPEIRRELINNRLQLPDLKGTKYKWFVVTKNEAGQTSPESAHFVFNIEGTPPLAWRDGLNDANFVYKTAKPFVRVAWDSGPGHPASWRVHFRTSREPAATPDWKVVQKPEVELNLPEDGTYFIQAESLDAAGAVIARTNLRSQRVVAMAPVAAPRFTSETPLDLEANDEGMLQMEWFPVRDAKSYVVHIKSPDGKSVQTVKSTTPHTELTRLKTGEYKVSLQSVDHLGRTSPEGEARKLHVPEYSDVKAPRLKNINVK